MTDIRRHGIKVPRTDSEAEAAQAARDILIDSAHALEQRFTHPLDDWPPAWVVLTQTQGTAITPDDRNAANDPWAKKAITLYVANYARRRGAIAIANLISAWTLGLDQDKLGRERVEEIERQVRARNGRIEDMPGRTEQLVVITYTAGSFDAHVATITRHDDAPPTLGPFEARDGLRSMGGRMSDPLQRALRRLG